MPIKINKQTKFNPENTYLMRGIPYRIKLKHGSPIYENINRQLPERGCPIDDLVDIRHDDDMDYDSLEIAGIFLGYDKQYTLADFAVYYDSRTVTISIPASELYEAWWKCVQKEKPDICLASFVKNVPIVDPFGYINEYEIKTLFDDLNMFDKDAFHQGKSYHIIATKIHYYPPFSNADIEHIHNELNMLLENYKLLTQRYGIHAIFCGYDAINTVANFTTVNNGKPYMFTVDPIMIEKLGIEISEFKEPNYESEEGE